MKFNKVNFKKINEDAFFSYVRDLIITGNPSKLSDFINYMIQGEKCKDCKESFVNCECEKCKECRFNRCLCNLNIKNKGYLHCDYLSDERNEVREFITIWLCDKNFRNINYKDIVNETYDFIKKFPINKKFDQEELKLIEHSLNILESCQK